MVAYIVFAVTLIAISVTISYFALPEGIRNGASAIIGSVMSLIVIPLIMNAINRKKENENKRFEANKELYVRLSKLFVQILNNNDFSQSSCDDFKRYIVENYGYMCVNFSSSLISEIHHTYRAYTNRQMDNVRLYAEKCMKHIRKEGGNGKDFMYSYRLLELMGEK